MLFIVYVLYANFIHDPQASNFLSHKTALKRALNTAVWLKVMNVHIIFACTAMIAGAVNFSSSIMKRHRKFHRVNGYFYLVSVLIVDLTSGYMAPYATGGKASSMGFNLMNIVWLVMTIIAIVKIRKKQVNQHRKWMTRSYAFVFTNLTIHALTWLLHQGFGLAYITSYTISVYGSILCLMLAAELVIRIVFRKEAF
ncbi:putative membrane protein [Paenibacillus qinlingensis]|uniref:Membrane protein n=1 Tax=Paenibacillus qinlingensis TaxID=1837343 RepID=A0ABU1NXB8_9BACL|nr:putative membrane protein [Paenibacillus qinlingensis]